MRKNDRVRLHLKSHRTIDGVLLRRRRGMFELGDARVEDEHGKLQPASGRVFVPACDVEFAQVGWAS
jgi:hypothetical protein